jgi:hypothetical protein
MESNRSARIFHGIMTSRDIYVCLRSIRFKEKKK